MHVISDDDGDSDDNNKERTRGAHLSFYSQKPRGQGREDCFFFLALFYVGSNFA